MPSATFEAGDTTLHKVRDYVWEIEQTGGMQVPARVLASEALLEEIADDMTLDQIQNVAHFPGIQKYAICMPDGHQGYGMPVGGVAGIDANEGCISPGAVGYDVNCLSSDTNINLQFGRKSKISTFAEDFEKHRVNVSTEQGIESSDIHLFTVTESQPTYQLDTVTGDTIQATDDHPFRTPEGMVELGDLQPGDTVFMNPFEGLPDETPEEFTILDEDDFADEGRQLVAFLQKIDLLPLKSTDENFHRLLKLAGFHTGDGAFRGPQTWFSGDPEDLESIREDIAALGFTPSRIYERHREHEIDGKTSESTEYSVKVSARSFKEVLRRLGVPDGKKVESDFTTPDCLENLTDWQWALYLSAYFGAEMNAPSAQYNMNLRCPKISQDRTAGVADAGEEFMREIKGYLADLDIESNAIERFEAETRDDMERLRLGIKNDSENLLRFFTTVGYRYNREKRRKAALAAQYLKLKERVIDRRADIAELAPMLADGGRSVSEISAEFDVHPSFVRRRLSDTEVGPPRPPMDFPGFEEFCETTEVRADLTVPVEIEAITEIGEQPVYDIGVAHEAHNFIADGFVVSNCGVRMVRTNLSYGDIQGREEELVNRLFEAIPSGLGGGGVVERDVTTVEAILDRGMDWALEQGFAVEDDLLHCEDEGQRPESDPDVVSHEAKQRGATQIGSLGSGNHFLEVQRVTDVYREDVADAFGLAPDQIVVLIHCGSRGLGHQVCTDYLREIEQRHEDLLQSLPDRELAAAPAGSQLADEYYRAMCGAINFAWVNRQLVMHRTREVFEDVFGRDWEELGMDLLYDVAHNIAKRETHDVEGEDRELFVHRKGATRAFPAGHPDVPRAYRDVGQPIIIPGSMGAGSYVLRGGEASLTETFGSTAHGAGRLMSRTQAKNEYWGGDVQTDLREQQHVYVKAQSGATIAEEAPGVYKDVDEVVRVSDALGIGDRVARTYPVCNIKG